MLKGTLVMVTVVLILSEFMIKGHLYCICFVKKSIQMSEGKSCVLFHHPSPVTIPLV